jgi:uncharacterized protein YbjT (DUF2867 family)
MILVIGGTGLVGAKVVEGLLAQGQQVRVLAAGYSDWRDNVTSHFRKVGVDVVSADMRDQRAMAAAVTACTGIIHTAGILQARPDQSLDSVNHQSLASLLPIAENAGIQRFVYVSCLGATQFNSSQYLQSKWEAETLVRQSKFYWTIFRPSVIFGTDSQLMRTLEFWTARFPWLLVVGSGLNHLQPVSADDVAACIVQSLYNRDMVGQTYDLVGPESLTLSELMAIVGDEHCGREKPVVKVPATAGYMIADILNKLNPRLPVSSEIFKLLTAEITSDPMLMQRNFQVRALPFESQYGRIAKST